MRINKILSTIFLFAFFTTILNAQLKFTMPKYKYVAEVKNRQPIVVVNPPDPSMVAKLAKRGTEQAMQEYQQAIGDYNTNMKNAVTKFWTFNSQPVLYKTRAELKDMFRDKSQRDKYVLIYCCSLMYYSRDFDWDVDKNGTKITGQRPTFVISFTFDDDPIYEFPFDDVIATPIAISYYVSKSNFIFNYLYTKQQDCKMKDMVSDNAHLLSQKTLLIPAEAVSKEIINNLKTYYPCNIKLVGYNEITNAVLSGDPAYVYINTTGRIFGGKK